MGKPIPNFVGERLTEAREAKAMNRSLLAELLGISRQAVSLYENGERTPNLVMLDRIAALLEVPVQRFTMPMPQEQKAILFFRSLAAATKTARARASRRLDFVRLDICNYLRRYVEFPTVNFPEPDVPPDPAALGFERIEEIASETRRFWKLGDGPIADLVMLLENNGAVVVRQDPGTNTLDAFSRRGSSDPTPYIVLGTDKRSAVRARYNAAHELGHMILHRKVPTSFVNRAEIHNLLEEQAHLFAGAFLLPEETFLADLVTPSIQAFAAIKQRWRVSVVAMIQRAHALESISDIEHERLFKYCSIRKWRRIEPYDDVIEPERPQFIERAFNLILQEGLATKKTIEMDIAMHSAAIESVLGLEEGFFGEDVQHLKFPRLNGAEMPPRPDNYSLRLPFN